MSSGRSAWRPTHGGAKAATCLAAASLVALSIGGGCSSASSFSLYPSLDSGPAFDSGAVEIDSSIDGREMMVTPEDAASTCAPANVSTFTPTWHPPAGPFAGLCSGDELDRLVAACFDKSSTEATCTAWQTDAANSQCLDCVAGPASATASTWAPVLYFDNPGPNSFPNEAGCLVLLDPTLTQCAHALEATISCDLLACVANCPVPADGGTAVTEAAKDLLQDCLDTANAPGGGCSGLAEEVTCLPAPDAGLVEDAGPASLCFDLSSDPVALRAYFALTCGGGASDGGRDAAEGGG